MNKNLTIFLLIISIFFLTNCTKSKINSSPNNQILKIGNGTEPKDLDPHTVTGVPEANLLAALMEGLISENPKDLSPLPGVAASWTISKDMKKYTFIIGTDRKWSNGDQLKARDFVYAWKRILSPAMASEYAYMLYCVENAEDFNKGIVKDFNKVGVKAINETTLEVILKSPTPYFISLLAHYSTFPIHQQTIEKFGKMDEVGTAWTRPGNFVGNGPFKLIKWELNRIISVNQNEHYWDKSNVKLKGIEFYPIDDQSTEERMFRTEQLHITSSVPISKIQVYKKGMNKNLIIAPYLGTYYYRLNVTKNTLKDNRIRKALSMSIDRNAIVERVTKGGQLPANSFVPAGTNGYISETSVAYNIDSARALLKEAGYPNGAGLNSIEILYNSSESHKKIALAIQQMWKDSLGIDVSLVNQDWKVYLSSQKSLNYDISRAGWIGDYADPNTFLDMFVSDGGNNQTGWSNKVYDSLINVASLQGEKKIRNATFQKAEEILLNESPIIPIYTYTKVYLKSHKVQGWSNNILDHHIYKQVKLTDVK